MDLITHALTGVLIGTIDRHKRKVAMSATLLGATVPDIGEILIQNALAKNMVKPSLCMIVGHLIPLSPVIWR
jgi:hypothetical protein